MIPANHVMREHQTNEIATDQARKMKNSDKNQYRYIEKSLIIYNDDNGFGLRIKGHSPVYVEHVHENGPAWRAGVRRFDQICKINGIPVINLEHKDIVLMFKNCIKFIGLTLICRLDKGEHDFAHNGLFYSHGLTNTHSIFETKLFFDEKSNGFSSKNNIQFKPGQNFLRESENITIWSNNEKAILSIPNEKELFQTELDRNTKGKDLDTYLTPLKNQFVINYNSPKRMFRFIVNYDHKLNNISRRQITNFNINHACQSQNSKTIKVPFQRSGTNHNFDQRSCGIGMQTLSSSSFLNKSSVPREKSIEEDNSKQIRSKPVVISKRIEIIKELIDTERTHTEKLKCLDEMFYKPLKENDLMNTEQLKSVFSCHRQLYKIHRQIYRTLLSANYNINGEPLIGNALIEIFEGSLVRKLDKAACLFCSCQATNVELLNKLSRKETKVGQFLAQTANQQSVGRLGVKDLLASCFQRLTKYPLLLESLLKSTPTSEALAAAARQNNQDSSSIDMNALTFAEERQFIAKALHQSRQILIHVNDIINVAISKQKLEELWKKIEKHPHLPRIDISKQQVVHEGPLTLRFSKRSFDVYVLLLTDYLIILNREGHDKYRLKFFSPDGKSSNNQHSILSPIFIVDEHLTTRDAATDENGFYLLCKRKDDSRIYEFASKSPSERTIWRDKVNWSVDKQMNRSLSDSDRRLSSVSTITKSSSEISSRLDLDSAHHISMAGDRDVNNDIDKDFDGEISSRIEGTISYVEDDGIVMPSNVNYSSIYINQAVPVLLKCQKTSTDLSKLFETKLKTND